MRRLVIRLIFFLGMVGVLAIAGYTVLDSMVRRASDPYLFRDIASIPPGTGTVMVLGAQVLPGNVPSTALAYRLQTALALYRQHKAGRFLMSGDGRSKYYNEVETMRLYAHEQGIDDSLVLADENGLRTYASCYRARTVYGLTRLIIVSQPDHVRRAVYTCRSLGIDAMGVTATEFSDSEFSVAYLEYRVREKAALVLAWFEVNVLAPRQ